MRYQAHGHLSIIHTKHKASCAGISNNKETRRSGQFQVPQRDWESLIIYYFIIKLHSYQTAVTMVTACFLAVWGWGFTLDHYMTIWFYSNCMCRYFALLVTCITNVAWSNITNIFFSYFECNEWIWHVLNLFFWGSDKKKHIERTNISSVCAQSYILSNQQCQSTDGHCWIF